MLCSISLDDIHKSLLVVEQLAKERFCVLRVGELITHRDLLTPRSSGSEKEVGLDRVEQRVLVEYTEFYSVFN